MDESPSSMADPNQSPQPPNISQSNPLHHLPELSALVDLSNPPSNTELKAHYSKIDAKRLLLAELVSNVSEETRAQNVASLIVPNNVENVAATSATRQVALKNEFLLFMIEGHFGNMGEWCLKLQKPMVHELDQLQEISRQFDLFVHGFVQEIGMLAYGQQDKPLPVEPGRLSKQSNGPNFSFNDVVLNLLQYEYVEVHLLLQMMQIPVQRKHIAILEERSNNHLQELKNLNS